MLYLGTSGWSYDHWIDLFYPNGLERREWLRFYARHFNTVEINMTFYRFPFPNMMKGWYNKTPTDFLFTLKANRLITHVKKFKNVATLTKRFFSLTTLIKEKLGCILWQLPPSLHFDERNMLLLDSFLSNLNKYNKSDSKNVIEFRHKSWWNKEAYKMLKKHKASFCIVSAPRLPDDFIVTSNVIYVRFHGVSKWYAHDYSKRELNEWAKKIRKTMKRKKIRHVYCYFNNDFNAYAVKNCLELKKILSTK